ncbi:Arginyl-tRNA-protein transferase [Handroanthus impetiginosus]|uniref:Arginyl-tRNA--protein transferase n=1 Tax=Handroanthus impetiginosus TaxID=429701 RepID=A0A2G9HVT8_9LAMI|nr:Arginyl-tRNA-protein transferase [Handroanthus impetiginosus]
MEKTCCPSYTIRLKASDFVPSKDQVRAYKRMQRFLDGSLHMEKTDKLTDEITRVWGSCSTAHNGNSNSAVMEPSEVDCDGKDKVDEFVHFLSHQIDNIVQLCMKSGEFSFDIKLPSASVKKVAPAKRKLEAENSEELVFSCNIAFQIAASLRRYVKQLKSSEHGLREVDDSRELSPKMIAEVLAGHSKQLTESCGLSVRACNGHINFYSSSKQADLVEAERGTLRKTSPEATSGNHKHSQKSCGGASQGQQRRLEIHLRRSSFEYEEYSLYRKYQLRVHNDIPDEITESSYKSFLVDTPLVHVPPNDDGAVPPCGFGSFHQQYVLDGRLIAVGVIDILPKCFSSKYLFWDPDFAFLSLGKYSALEEIKWITKNQAHCPSLQYYYLGYYTHSCSKMRYKAGYRPSELLCPRRYRWVPYDIGKPYLDRRKYVVLSDYVAFENHCHYTTVNKGASNDVFIDEDKMAEVDSESSNGELDLTTRALEDVDLSNVLIGVGETRMRFKDLQCAVDPGQLKFMESSLQRHVKAVGKELSEKIVFSPGWISW